MTTARTLYILSVRRITAPVKKTVHRNEQKTCKPTTTAHTLYIILLSVGICHVDTSLHIYNQM